ncbi:MAG: amidohydrolase [Oscillospiraceae bacterium]|nr:amidohydrolase [Oscillospiraceae bacterium]
MKVIDFEYHGYIPEVLEAMSKRKTYPIYDKEANFVHWTEHISQTHAPLKRRLERRYDERVASMERDGIDVAVLSSSPGIEDLDFETAAELCRKTNDTIYEHMKRYPGKFYGSATLPVMNPQAACDELKRCVEELGFSAWHAHSNFAQSPADDPMYYPIYEMCEKLGVYIYLHPKMPDHERFRGFGFPFAGAAMGFTVDTQIVLIRLMLSGLFDRLPNLKIMLGHLGEALPFLLERIDGRLSSEACPGVEMTKSIGYYFENNILISTSGNMSAAAFQCAKTVMGIDRMFYGSDHPYEDPKDMRDFLAGLPLTDEERAKLYYQNGEKLLGIKL